MIQGKTRVLALVILTGVIVACGPSLVPGLAPEPTFDPNSLLTAIVETANAAAAQTAQVASPTTTTTAPALPSITPSITSTPTATFIFILPTATVPSETPLPGSSGKTHDCAVVSKTPQDNSHISPRAEFIMVWNVLNMGTLSWSANNVDYHYKGGDVLHKNTAYDLPGDVASGSQVELMVEMKAPEQGGTFTTTWAIRDARTEFCDLTITIMVP